MHAYIFIHNSKIAKYIESNVSVYIKKNVLVTYLKWMNKFMKNHRNGVMPAIPYTYFHSILDICVVGGSWQFLLILPGLVWTCLFWT